MNRQRTRQLAAVMFTDMVGFTALMGRDEAAARAKRDRKRDVLERLVGQFGGRVRQFFGDGALSVFGSAVEAARCAVAIQEELRRPPEVSLRIGIHSGDIVDEGDGIYGDGVNVAARVEALAPAGGVLISDTVFEAIRNHRDLAATSIGTARLKNVERPVELFALESKGLTVPGPGHLERTTALAPAADQGSSVAVLPFANVSSDPENEYFCDGIAEDIINALGQLPGLKVAGRTSAFFFKGRVVDLREVGATLNVATVLEGSVRKVGDQLRITAQLVDVANGYHLWSERFDRRLDDIFAIQDEIATNIAERLEVTIGGSGQRSRPQTNNVQAYELYLKGRALLYQRGMAMLQARTCFEQALALDPAYALAHAGLADSHTIPGYHGFIAPSEAWSPARKAAERALELAPELAEAHNARAIVAFVRDWDWNTANRAFRRSLDLNPGYVQARVWYAVASLQATRGDHDAAVAEARAAVEIDPLSSYTHIMLAYVLNFAGRVEEAAEEAQKAVETDPGSYWGQFALATAHHGAGRLADAEGAYRRALSESGRIPLVLANLARLHSDAQRPEDASAVAAELMARSRQEYVQPSTLALAAACATKAEEAVALLRRAEEERDPWLAWGAMNAPWFEPLRALPGYKDLLGRMNLPAMDGDP